MVQAKMKKGNIRRNIKKKRKKKERIKNIKSLYRSIFRATELHINHFFRRNEEEEEQEEGEVVEPHPLVSVTDINPEDIPEVPTNKFLLRAGGSKEEKRGGKLSYSIIINNIFRR